MDFFEGTMKMRLPPLTEAEFAKEFPVSEEQAFGMVVHVGRRKKRKGSKGGQKK